jgi:HSP20 family protein
MDRMFNEFFEGFGLAPFRPFDKRGENFSPRVDVVESDDEIRIACELPGMDTQDIDVTLSGEALTISGDKKVEEEHKGRNYYRMERSYGSFQRSIPLSSEGEANKVDAAFKNGVLTITLPKTAESKSRKSIPIKTE